MHINFDSFVESLFYSYLFLVVPIRMFPVCDEAFVTEAQMIEMGKGCGISLKEST